MKLLLLSNSRGPDGSYLVHAAAPIRDVIGTRTKALFLPFAGVTQGWDEYTAKVAAALAPTGLALTGAHTSDPKSIADFDVVVAGGGNTFQLVKECRARGWLPAIRKHVQGGAPFIGWSAGANLACPTLCTTNDMPIVDPQGFDALGLVSFQINPHYTNALPAGHQGETRNERIAEYLTANPASMVVALPEGDWLTVDDKATVFHGPHKGYVFRHAIEAVELMDGSVIPAR
jgi:dipeptidase E